MINLGFEDFSGVENLLEELLTYYCANSTFGGCLDSQMIRGERITDYHTILSF